MKKKRWGKTLLQQLASVCFYISSLHKNMKKLMAFILMILLFIPSNYSVKNNNVIISIGPYTQNVSNDSITIVWETNLATSNNSVEYWNEEQKYFAYDYNNSIHHEIRISPPFSTGYYRVASDGVKSKVYKLEVAKHCYENGKFKCIIYGDSRGKWDNWKHAKEVANAINKERPDIVIHGGDMVADGRDVQQWNEWLSFMMPLMQNTTLFPVLGNHERNASRYYEIFSLPNNEMWYSFYYGPCHFIILDEYAPWDKTSSQYKWLEKQLAMPSAFKIVCFHEPIYCSGGHFPRRDIRKVWEPLFIKYGVNIVFQSHNHYYQRTNPINGIIYVVTGGGGAPLYEPGNAWFVNKSAKVYHYCVLDVDVRKMKMHYYVKDINGNVIDSLDFSPAAIKIVKPSNALYIFNRKIVDMPYPLIIGKIDVVVNAPHVKGVEFYIDGNLKFNDTIPPYSWQWNEMAIGKHKIMAKAYGGNESDERDVIVFNL